MSQQSNPQQMNHAYANGWGAAPGFMMQPLRSREETSSLGHLMSLNPNNKAQQGNLMFMPNNNNARNVPVSGPVPCPGTFPVPAKKPRQGNNWKNLNNNGKRRNKGSNNNANKKNNAAPQGVRAAPQGVRGGYEPPKLHELQAQNRLKARKYFHNKKRKHNNSGNNGGGGGGYYKPLAPRNTTSFIMRAKKAGGIASLVSPCPVTPAILPTPVISPACEGLTDMAKAEWGVDGYGTMKGLIRLKDKDAAALLGAEDDDTGSSESDVEEHVEVERRLDHDVSRFEMIYPGSNPNPDGPFNGAMSSPWGFVDQESQLARLEEENLTLKERLFLMQREMDDLRRRLEFLECRNPNPNRDDLRRRLEFLECRNPNPNRDDTNAVPKPDEVCDNSHTNNNVTSENEDGFCSEKSVEGELEDSENLDDMQTEPVENKIQALDIVEESIKLSEFHEIAEESEPMEKNTQESDEIAEEPEPVEENIQESDEIAGESELKDKNNRDIDDGSSGDSENKIQDHDPECGGDAANSITSC